MVWFSRQFCIQINNHRQRPQVETLSVFGTASDGLSDISSGGWICKDRSSPYDRPARDPRGGLLTESGSVCGGQGLWARGMSCGSSQTYRAFWSGMKDDAEQTQQGPGFSCSGGSLFKCPLFSMTMLCEVSPSLRTWYFGNAYIAGAFKGLK